MTLHKLTAFEVKRGHGVHLLANNACKFLKKFDIRQKNLDIYKKKYYNDYV